MGRTKGSKNKKVEAEINKKKVEAIIKDLPEDIKADLAIEVPGPEACGCGSRNPLVGYTLDEARGFLAELNPNCGRGGCLHAKEFHIKNIQNKLECHKCKCAEFL